LYNYHQLQLGLQSMLLTPLLWICKEKFITYQPALHECYAKKVSNSHISP